MQNGTLLVKYNFKEELRFLHRALSEFASSQKITLVINTEWTRKAFQTSDKTVIKHLQNVCGIYWVKYHGFIGGYKAKEIAEALNRWLRGRHKSYAFGKKVQCERDARNVYKQWGSDTLGNSSPKKNSSLKKFEIRRPFISNIISNVCQVKIRSAVKEAIADKLLNFEPNIVFSMDLLHSREIPVFESSALELRRDYKSRKFTFKQKIFLAIKRGLMTLYGSAKPCLGARTCRKNIFSYKTCRKTQERQVLEMVKSYISPGKRRVLEFNSLKPIIDARLKKEIASVIRKASRYAKRMRYSLREYFLDLHRRIYDLVPILSQNIITRNRNSLKP